MSDAYSATAPVPVSEPKPPTNTLDELYTALIADREKRETAHDERADARHKTVVNKLNSIEGRVDEHDRRIKRVENNAFPERALWAIAVLIACYMMIEVYRIDHPTVRYVTERVVREPSATATVPMSWMMVP